MEHGAWNGDHYWIFAGIVGMAWARLAVSQFQPSRVECTRTRKGNTRSAVDAGRVIFVGIFICIIL